MRNGWTYPLVGSVALLLAYGISADAFAQTRTIRVVTYNIMADLNVGSETITNPLAGLIAPFTGTGTFTQNSSGSVTNGGALEGIGEEILAGNYQPIDILALQETTNNAVGVQPIVNGLNVFYSSRNITAVYAMSSLQLTSTGGSGGGPNALVYNTNTLQLIASVGVGTPSVSGEARQVGRYLFAPAGVATNALNIFYVYVSHYKSGTNSDDLIRRGIEAGIIRTNSATLPANSRVLYVGDYNVSTSSETSYQAIVSSSIVSIGIQGVDPFNTNGSTGINWTQNSLLSNKTESVRSLHFRDDFQIMSSNVYYGAAGGLAYVPGTYHTFGNNGTTPYLGTVINNANTALNGNLQPSPPISAAQCRTNLYGASDHYPVVADYTIPIPVSPPSAIFSGSPTNGLALLTVTFSDASTGSITNRFWNFGDSSMTNVTTNTVSHVYTAGVYNVTLIVSGPGGADTNTQPNYIIALTAFQTWQIQYFGSTDNPSADPNADPDGDDQNNIAEFLSGTDPTNSSSALQITSLVRQGDDVLVAWTMGGGKTNALQFSAGDVGGNYSTNFADLFVVTNTVGSATNYLDLGAATNVPSRYYRVWLVP